MYGMALTQPKQIDNSYSPSEPSLSLTGVPCELLHGRVPVTDTKVDKALVHKRGHTPLPQRTICSEEIFSHPSS